MSGCVTFKIFVRSTAKCLEILRYLDKNITTINAVGAKVQVEKIVSEEVDDDLLHLFRQKGISRLPALLAPDGKVFIGLKQITDVFDRNINNMANNKRFAAGGGDGGAGSYIDYEAGGNAELGSNPDMTDFWMRELYSGCDRRGRYIPRKDKDEREDEGADIERKLADYRRRVPKHRRTDRGQERDIDMPIRGRRAPRDDDDDAYDDNVADSDDESPPRRGRGGRAPPMAPTGDIKGDDMDRRMLAAWIDKTPTEE
jgi:hypothetical protein